MTRDYGGGALSSRRVRYARKQLVTWRHTAPTTVHGSRLANPRALAVGRTVTLIHDGEQRKLVLERNEGYR